MPTLAARKTVLIVAPDFAPSSLPPALRIRFFASHLPEFGWEPIVLTTDSAEYEHINDPENERLLPADLRVIRSSAFPARFTRKFGLGDLGLRSLWQHWRAMKKLVRGGNVDAVFISVPPNYTMALARLAWNRFRIPYVIDYVDPVVTEHYWKLPPAQRPPKWRVVYPIMRRLESFTLKHVAFLIGVDRSYLDEAFRRCPWLREDMAAGIPYGGEPGDFDYVRTHPRANRIFDPNDGLLHVSYVGRGGTDMLATLRTIFSGVRQGLQSDPELFRRLRLHFVGTTYAPDAEKHYQVLPLAREMGLAGVLDEHPARVAYLDAIQLFLDSHALVIPGSELPHYTASKIFPYILSRRPLLAVFHEQSSVVKILRETKAGDAVTFSDAESLAGKSADIRDRLRTVLQQPRSAEPATDWTAFDAYTARAMSRQLAAIFDRVTAGKS